MKDRKKRMGLLPGEYQRRSLVTVERVARASDKEPDLLIQDHYIVVTRRLDGVWRHVVELHGQSFELPGRVVERIQAQRQSIITEQRRHQARERIVAQADALVGTKRS